MTRKEPSHLAVERTCYELCETGRFMDAYSYLQLSKGKFISIQEAVDIQDSLIEDYQGFRQLM